MDSDTAELNKYLKKGPDDIIWLKKCYEWNIWGWQYLRIGPVMNECKILVFFSSNDVQI